MTANYQSQMDLNNFLNKTPFDSIMILFLYISEQLAYKSNLIRYIKGKRRRPPKDDFKFSKFVHILYTRDDRSRSEPGISIFNLNEEKKTLETLDWKRIILNKTNFRKYRINEAYIENPDFTVLNIKFPRSAYVNYDILNEIKGEMEEICKDGKYLFFDRDRELALMDGNAKPIFEVLNNGYHVKVYGKVERIILPKSLGVRFFNEWMENFTKE